MKENDGRGARKQLIRRLILIIGGFVLLLGILELFGIGGGRQRRQHPLSIQGNKERVAKLLRKRLPKTKTTPDSTVKTISLETNPDVVDQILSASMHLVDITVHQDQVAAAPADSYGGVYGEFCKVDFNLHKTDPSSVPMFRDVIAASPHCQQERYKINLYEIATRAREHDARIVEQQGDKNTDVVVVPKSLELTAAVFHESRCGSTLVANSLIAMDPKRHRVYSESAPPLKALMACGGDASSSCSKEQGVALLRDVVYLMGRTHDTEEERLFLKIQSAGTLHLDMFLQAFPTTPWMFVYRDPVQVMMSHLKQGKSANCVRNRKRPTDRIRTLVKDHGRHVEELSLEEYCAAHLAAITESAVVQMTTSQTKGIPINYDDLPNILFTQVLPHDIGIPLGDEEISRIAKVASVYSKGRGDRAGAEWHQDSEKKEHDATEQVKKAAAEFLQESYDVLQGKED